MKTFSFLAGNKADPSNDVQIQVDRSSVPAGAKVGLWLDDDGKLFPQIPRASRVRPSGVALGAEFILLDRARIRTKLGAVEGVLTVEPGTKFDLEPSGEGRVLEHKGGEVSVVAGRRFLDVNAPIGVVRMNKQPNEVKVFTVQWEPPAGARRGERSIVHVTQKNATGTVMGGITIEFVVD
ncbi:MAG TPA: hypothetical protein VL137_14745 [Polyangiaceae bacterium]|nr:hypothetical protein [Polyangiaceae bacterium]